MKHLGYLAGVAGNRPSDGIQNGRRGVAGGRRNLYGNGSRPGRPRDKISEGAPDVDPDQGAQVASPAELTSRLSRTPGSSMLHLMSCQVCYV